MTRRVFLASATLAVALCTAGCKTTTAPQTGLTGTATRSPILPVCREGEICSAPLAATFEARRGSRVIASFHSDADGHFTVYLAPGDYAVWLTDPQVAGFLISTVTYVHVEDVGLTHADLEYDTGIR